LVLLLAAFHAVATSGIPFGYVAVFARLSCKVFLGYLNLWLIADTSAFDAPCAPHKSFADMAMLTWLAGEIGFAAASLGLFLGNESLRCFHAGPHEFGAVDWGHPARWYHPNLSR
jgi:hypothetical protein